MELCREYGISKATLYNCLKKSTDMDSGHKREFNTLQEENRRLKQIYAELMLDHQLGKHNIEKSCKVLSEFVVQEQSVSFGRACSGVNLERSLWFYQSNKDDGPLLISSVYWPAAFPTSGFDKYYAII